MLPTGLPTPTLASIPSPSRGILHLGPLPLHAYGLCLAAGVVVATVLAERRWKARGHDPKQIADMALWLVVWGVIGARLYHVITDYELYTHHPVDALKIWDGGLGIWGAVGAGAVAAIVMCRRRNIETLPLFDAMGPAVAVAQGIGRWGNYFNQELFGRPTSLPWGLEISASHRPVAYRAFTTFQPTFLYESLWCFALFGAIVLVEHRFRLRKGQSFALYVAIYTFGRFFFENMRSDPAHKIFGMRLNAWVSLVLFIAATAWFAYLARHAEYQSEPDHAGGTGDGTGAVAAGAHERTGTSPAE